MTAASFVSAASGIGRQGFVTEHGLHTADEQSTAEQIDRLGIETIRAVGVDQHGTPRAKFPSPQAVISTLSSGGDFSGAICGMDTANFVYPAAFAAGGEPGIAAADLPARHDDIARGLQPPPPVTSDPHADPAPPPPTTLLDAIAELDKDQLYREQYGLEAIDSSLLTKRAAYADTAAARWQQREYVEFS